MTSKSKNLVEIAFGLDSKLAPHISGSISSIIDNSRGAQLRFIILSSVTNEWFQKRIQKAFASAIFEWIKMGEADVPVFKANAAFTRAALFRLAIDKFAPRDCKRVIYLDADVILTTDIQELWNTDLGKYPIAAVPDENVDAAEFAKRWRLPTGGEYLNSGVLVIDLERARSMQTFSLARDFVARHNELAFPEQDALNFAFWRNWLKLDPSWNVQRPSAIALAFGDRQALRGGVPKIVHFTGVEKPWLPKAYHPWAWLYWRALGRTPFTSDVQRHAHLGALGKGRLWLRWHRPGFREVNSDQTHGRTPLQSLNDLGELIDISLIVATRNRAKQLAGCLQAICKLAFDGAWEVIVVDNGSTDETSSIIERARSTMPAPLIALFEPERGAARARNRGIRVARGRIVAFTDDDCYVDQKFLTETVRAFADERMGYITGRVELYDESDADATVNRSRTPKRYRPHNYIYTDDVIGANLAFRRAVLGEIGGFDERMGAGQMFSAEDVDAAGRAASAGWEGAYRPEVLVHHHHGRKQADLRKLHKFYDIGRGAYTIKYLLRGEFVSFLKGVASLRWRMGPIWTWRLATFSTPAWEFFGATSYLLLHVRALLGGTARHENK
jgi:lipopolysaccharide biosynthesis glycosyltransferase/glycosyltransferase involved in cell wall biosynthesis